MKNHTALITGADGFIGSHLTELLVREGFQVKALSQYNAFNHWGWLEDLACLDEIEVLTGDVRDPHCCRKITENVDVVFHLAALIAIPYSYRSPDSYVETNVKGTLNICRAALDNRCGKVIHVSTSEVYGTAQYVPIDETHPLQPQSPYSASKIAADMMALSFHHAFELPVTVARPFNTYGPRQSARAVIPAIITQIADGMDEIKLGDISPTRDFNYVEDTCGGLLALARCDKAVGDVVNIGSNSEVGIGNALDLIMEIMRKKVRVICDQERVRPSGSEVRRLRCDNAKLRSLTGFSPAYAFRQGLEKTVAWFSEPKHRARYKSHVYNV